jgi:hypothetical protein
VRDKKPPLKKGRETFHGLFEIQKKGPWVWVPHGPLKITECDVPADYVPGADPLRWICHHHQFFKSILKICCLYFIIFSCSSN